MKKIHDYFNQLMVFSLIVFVTACSPAIKNKELPPASSPSPTSTIMPSPTLTATPPSGFIPNHFVENDNFGDGFIARILIKDTNKLSQEDIAANLVSLLLEHYKTTKELSPRIAIKDYENVYVYKLIKDNNNYDDFFDIVVFVKFSIIPLDPPSANDWASLPGDGISLTDPWWHLGSVFGIFQDGEYFRLRIMPGWGT